MFEHIESMNRPIIYKCTIVIYLVWTRIVSRQPYGILGEYCRPNGEPHLTNFPANGVATRISLYAR